MFPLKGFALILVLIYKVKSFTLNAPDNDLVHFEPNGNKENQNAYMNENNPANTTIAIISGAGSTPEVTIQSDEKLFGLIVSQQGKDWLIIASMEIDFEAMPGNHRFSIIIKADSDATVLTLYINNLDDENPSIIPVGSCNMDEVTSITTANSNCTFTVRDPDGFLDKMVFKIKDVPNKQEIQPSEVFDFEYLKQPDHIEDHSAEVALILKPGQSLDYSEKFLWSFSLMATDSGGNPTIPLSEIQIIVKVNDMPNQDPVWVNFFYVAEIFEETEYLSNFSISARDGDYGIDNPISYKIVNCTPDGYVTIGQKTGVFNITSIDRDNGIEYEQIFVNVQAYDEHDHSSILNGSLEFFVMDMDDNSPEIRINGTEVSSVHFEIDENYDKALPLNITVHDPDSGQHAMFSIRFEDVTDGPKFSQAFQAIPQNGYQNSDVTINVVQVDLLDYEDPKWINISFKLVTAGSNKLKKSNELLIKITLKDINDEYPTFDDDDAHFNLHIKESIRKDETIATFSVSDKDAGDVVTLTLGNSANTILYVDGYNVKTKIDNAFDYEKQSEVFVILQITDSANHITTKQLNINVDDVDDENPTISVDNSLINIDENFIGELDIQITATDQDTKSNLEFSIDWDKSYVVKDARKLDGNDAAKKNCIDISTNPHDPSAREIKATLKTKQPVPDYELYDTLYLFLIVNDTLTVEGTGIGSTMITISINDINDNLPYFPNETKTVNRTVSELSPKDTPLVSIIAKDQDRIDTLTYHMEYVHEGEETKDWIKINPKTGELTVTADNQISCDYPNPTWTITYLVTVSDGKHNISSNFSIFLIDQNTADPVMADITTKIEENAPLNKTIYYLNAHDNDRDEPYNVMSYKIGNDYAQNLANKFRIFTDDSLVNNSIAVSGQLIWTDEENEYNFTIDCTDNPKGLGMIRRTSTKVNIKIIDINNNSPILITKSIIGNENMKKGDSFEKELTATDADSPGYFSQINFQPDKLVKLLKCGSNDIDDSFNEVLFDVHTDAKPELKNAKVTALVNLRNHYGCYILTIRLNDYNDANKIGNSEKYDLHIEIQRYNFYAPEIRFPVDGLRYYFDSAQTLNTEITTFDNNRFGKLHASDKQGEKYDIQFTVDDGGLDIFTTDNAGSYGQSTGILSLKSLSYTEHTVYNLTITASIDGPDDDPISTNDKPHSTAITISVIFLKQDTDPIFVTRVQNVTIPEGKRSKNFSIPIEKAHYDEGFDDNFPKYYMLYKGDRQTFDVDKTNGTVTVKVEFDYANITSYHLIVRTSRSEFPNDAPSNSSLLNIYIDVENINNHYPEFESPAYYKGLLDTYPRSSTILTLHATDLDGDLNALEYSIQDNVIIGSNDVLNNLNEKFSLDPNTGAVISKFQVTSGMDGYFTFTALVNDSDHVTEASVKIYIVTAINRVEFRFENNKEDVVNGIADIDNVLNEQFSDKHYEANVFENLIENPDASDYVICPTYFINTEENLPIEATEILKLLTNVQTFNNLKKKLNDKKLFLAGFKNQNDTKANMEEILKAWLIGVSVVLGALCLILLIAFFLRTKSLNQRIDKLSSTRFGSQESGLNRIGITAPTTNKHAIEGSNPVFNNEIDSKEIDRRSSNASGDSDLIGVEDNPEFAYDDNNIEETSNGHVNNGYMISHDDNDFGLDVEQQDNDIYDNIVNEDDSTTRERF